MKIRKETIIELATYIIVASAIMIISPLLGKYIDNFDFQYDSVVADSRPVMLSGLFLVLLGSLLVAWTIYLFKTEGHGTPNPKLPPKEFIVSGPYRHSRNPMALGGLLILLGESMFYYSPSLLCIGVLFGIIIYFNAQYVEEPELRDRFGEPYEEYLQEVPRLFPNLFNSSISNKNG